MRLLHWLRQSIYAAAEVCFSVEVGSLKKLLRKDIAMSGALKRTTGLTGLAVATNPHHTLGALYGKILRALQKMPSDAAYRRYTEQIVTERARIVSSTPDVKVIESKIGCGQVEELIVQAENELVLARKMLGWKPWEPLATPPPATQWDWPPAKITQGQ